MDSRLKKILLSTSALVGFTLVPGIANADPVSASIIVSSAITAAGTALASSSIALFSATTLKMFAFYTASGFVLNALQPKPSMPNLTGLGSSTGNTTTQGTASMQARGRYHNEHVYGARMLGILHAPPDDEQHAHSAKHRSTH